MYVLSRNKLYKCYISALNTDGCCEQILGEWFHMHGFTSFLIGIPGPQGPQAKRSKAKQSRSRASKGWYPEFPTARCTSLPENQNLPSGSKQKSLNTGIQPTSDGLQPNPTELKLFVTVFGRSDLTSGTHSVFPWFLSANKMQNKPPPARSIFRLKNH